MSSWLEKDPDQESVISPAKNPDADEDTVTGASLSEAPPWRPPRRRLRRRQPKRPAQAKEKAPAKAAGKLQSAAKQNADSGGAASEMLKNFFSKKR